MTTKYKVAIVGATGIVGEAFLTLLAERDFPISQLYPLASSRSAGDTVMFRDKPIVVEDIEGFDFSQVQFAFFSAGSDVSLTYAPIAAELGCTVIDNTSAFRYEDDIALVVPEVNATALKDYRETNIIANPNCSTIQLVTALKPIYDAFGVDRVNIATYQSVSGAGRDAIDSLVRETSDLLGGKPVEKTFFSKQIAFNVVPEIDAWQDNGYTKEEMKLVWETQKILGDKTIRINPTAVRVPVFFGHSEAVHLETKQRASAAEIIALLEKAPGVVVLKDNDYPTAITHAVDNDAVFVGRIRDDISHENGINLWVVSDNVRKGAALNAIQIAELLSQNSFYMH